MRRDIYWTRANVGSEELAVMGFHRSKGQGAILNRHQKGKRMSSTLHSSLGSNMLRNTTLLSMCYCYGSVMLACLICSSHTVQFLLARNRWREGCGVSFWPMAWRKKCWGFWEMFSFLIREKLEEKAHVWQPPPFESEVYAQSSVHVVSSHMTGVIAAALINHSI